jgi:hypothetical protein
MVAQNRFLPNFGRPPIRDGAPQPQERPFDLGQGNDRVAENYPQRSSAELRLLASQALARHPVDPRLADVSPDTELPRVMPMPSPVSAYAPVRQDGSLAVSSGRGLY